ncbi:hypothetical protein [Dawidia soli]|uniref:Uncharacterized protein n=1 Tax=Dawidia soli TaxID=2782352 RepID=A0AAP2GK10_9BACT|nr:hypothetical protein [Dawidia soli]MBT1689946.1 hypothetical protein [Dawidia soli]
MATTTLTRKPARKAAKVARAAKPVKAAKAVKKDVSRSYNAFKEFDGQHYTGMQVGRSHKWNYDKGVWRETKVTPDRWELTYSVIKRRAGHAPEGSGVPIGTGYHWFILSHQYVEKLNANDYTTSMVGLKFKLAHKRASKDTWSASDTAQRNKLIEILRGLIDELEREPEKTVPVPLHFVHKEKDYKGVAIPVISSCVDGVCQQLDVTLNKKHVGVLKYTRNGWRITDTPQGLVNAISAQVEEWYNLN